MKKTENKFDRDIRENIIEALESVVSIPREYWETQRSKRREEVTIRQIYIYMLRTHTTQTLQSIAEICGFKYHTSVLRNCEIVDQWIKNPGKYPYQNKIVKEFYKKYAERSSDVIEAPIG